MKKFTLFLLTLTLLMSSGVAAAPAMPEVLFILDASGSMQGDAGGQAKMAAAKEVMRSVVPGLPPEVRVGLAAYGHRQPKDCADVELLVPPGSVDRDRLLAVVEGMEPRGMTPISLAVTESAKALSGRDVETTMVLVSDGKETCEGDPCAVVRALKAKGIAFVMHVVGFDVDADGRAQLECMAQAGGGRYFAAHDTASLKAALDAVGKELQEKVEKAKATTVRRKTGLGKLRLQMPPDALKSISAARIVRASDGKQMKEGELPGPDSTHPLLSGDYEVVLLYANPNYKPPTEVLVGQVAVSGGETAEMTFGALAYNLADELGGYSIDAVRIVDAATGKPFLVSERHGNGYYLFTPKPLPAGTYDVELQYYRSPKPMPLARGLVVQSGQTTYLTMDAGLQLKETESGISGWDLVPAGSDAPLLEVRRGWDNSEPMWRTFIVPPGVYDLMVHVKGMEEPLPAAEGLELKPGEKLEFDTGL